MDRWPESGCDVFGVRNLRWCITPVRRLVPTGDPWDLLIAFLGPDFSAAAQCLNNQMWRQGIEIFNQQSAFGDKALQKRDSFLRCFVRFLTFASLLLCVAGLCWFPLRLYLCGVCGSQ